MTHVPIEKERSSPRTSLGQGRRGSEEGNNRDKELGSRSCLTDLETIEVVEFGSSVVRLQFRFQNDTPLYVQPKELRRRPSSGL